MRFILLKKNQVTTTNVLPLLLPHFAPIFYSNFVSFVEGEAQEYFLAQGTLATPLHKRRPPNIAKNWPLPS